jgi:hypothetical protein
MGHDAIGERRIDRRGCKRSAAWPGGSSEPEIIEAKVSSK